jgi:hypothetical protein
LGSYFNVNSFFCSIKVNFLQGVYPSCGIVKLPYRICSFMVSFLFSKKSSPSLA